MATRRQTAANRRNARQSTGPRYPAGKAAARSNAVKHGLYAQSILVPGENPDHFQQLAQEYLDRFRPWTPEQRHYLQRVITCDWFRHRYLRIISELISHRSRQEEEIEGRDFDPGTALGCVCSQNDQTLARMYRVTQANERTYDRALTALKALQAEEPAPQPQPTPPLTPELASFRQPAATPPPSAPQPPANVPDRPPQTHP